MIATPCPNNSSVSHWRDQSVKSRSLDLVALFLLNRIMTLGMENFAFFKRYTVSIQGWNEMMSRIYLKMLQQRED